MVRFVVVVVVRVQSGLTDVRVSSIHDAEHDESKVAPYPPFLRQHARLQRAIPL
jgi:hypothetical protein